jgi:hypothetical protein
MKELVSLSNFVQPNDNGIITQTNIEAQYYHLPESLRKHVPELLEWFELALRKGDTNDSWFVPLHLHNWSSSEDGRFEEWEKEFESIRWS